MGYWLWNISGNIKEYQISKYYLEVQGNSPTRPDPQVLSVYDRIKGLMANKDQDWWVYMVRCGDGSLYTGITTDVKKRFREHRGQGGKGAKYLRGRGPLHLVLKKKIGNKGLALKVENHIKKLAKEDKEALIKNTKLVKEIIRICDQ